MIFYTHHNQQHPHLVSRISSCLYLCYFCKDAQPGVKRPTRYSSTSLAKLLSSNYLKSEARTRKFMTCYDSSVKPIEMQHFLPSNWIKNSGECSKHWNYLLMYRFLHGTFLDDLSVFWLKSESAGISLGSLQMRPPCPDWQNKTKPPKKQQRIIRDNSYICMTI